MKSEYHPSSFKQSALANALRQSSQKHMSPHSNSTKPSVQASSKNFLKKNKENVVEYTKKFKRTSSHTSYDTKRRTGSSKPLLKKNGSYSLNNSRLTRSNNTTTLKSKEQAVLTQKDTNKEYSQMNIQKYVQMSHKPTSQLLFKSAFNSPDCQKK